MTEYVDGAHGRYEKRFSGTLIAPTRKSRGSKVGESYFRLKFVERLGRQGKRQIAGFACTCGNHVATDIANVKTGSTKSCGCWFKEYVVSDERCALLTEVLKSGDHARKARATRWSRSKPTEVSERRAYQIYEFAAKKRGLSWELPLGYFISISQGVCYLCGSPPLRAVHSKGSERPFFCNGIDRVENTLGYTVQNCRPCCSRCNEIKMGNSLNDTLAHIKKMLEWQSSEDLFR